MATSFVLFLVMIVAVCTANPTITVSKCAAEDTKCLKKSAQDMIPIFANGIPEYEMEKMDPMVFKNDLDASTSQLSLKVKNIVVTGLKGCTAEKIERDLVKSQMHTRFLCNVQAHGKYEMHGQLLIVPIEGEGDAHVDLNKLQINVETDMNDRTGKDGKKHWHIKKSRFSYELKDKSRLKFENLFNGNEVLARAANDIIESSSNEVVKELGTPIIKAIVDKIIENINKFYKAIPAEEVALD